VDTTVRYLAALCDYVAPDSLIVMPTGAAANQLDIMEALVAKVRTAAPAFERPPRTVRMSGTGGTMVKGAAVGAVVEHGVKAAVDSLRSAVEGQVPPRPSTVRVKCEAFASHAVVSSRFLKRGLRCCP
jgi:hypothetical protein